MRGLPLKATSVVRTRQARVGHGTTAVLPEEPRQVCRSILLITAERPDIRPGDVAEHQGAISGFVLVREGIERIELRLHWRHDAPCAVSIACGLGCRYIGLEENDRVRLVVPASTIRVTRGAKAAA